MEPNYRHQCLIYDGPPSHKLPILAAIIKNKINEGYRCLYLNSAPMVAGIRSTLASMSIDVASEIAKGRLILSSDPVSLDGEFDSKLMLEKLERFLNQAINDGYNGLWASGDMTWEFGPRKDFSKLLEYESGLEEMFIERKELCGVCQYHRDTLPEDVVRQGLLIHANIVINETWAQINPHYMKSSWPLDSATRQKIDKTLAGLSEKTVNRERLH